MTLTDVPVSPLDLDRYRPLLADTVWADLDQTRRRAREVLEGRVVWNINSTAHGGGVAEMLRPLLAYARGAGIDARWDVIGGDPLFFTITKRLHNRLHGVPGDGGPLDATERGLYEAALMPSAGELCAR